jgi:hypothetical protein
MSRGGRGGFGGRGGGGAGRGGGTPWAAGDPDVRAEFAVSELFPVSFFPSNTALFEKGEAWN